MPAANCLGHSLYSPCSSFSLDPHALPLDGFTVERARILHGECLTVTFLV